MFPYFLITGCIVIVAILFPQRRPNRLAWGVAYVSIVLFTGLRHNVGMDWNNYINMIRNVGSGSLLESFGYAEPAFAALLWVSAKLGAGVYGINLVVAAIFAFGLFRLARNMPLPWLALAVAMPILVIVVSMSANRQAVAIGILLWLVADWERSSVAKRVLFTISAAMFHLSAIFFLVFAALGFRIRPGYKLLLTGLMSVVMVAFLQVSGGADYYDQLYISGESDLIYSPGATQHVLLNGLPAAMVLLGRRIRRRLFPSTLLVQMAWLAMALIPAALIFSVAASRMTLYLFPVSMYALSGLPDLLGDKTLRAGLRTVLGVFMACVLWFWLVFANTSSAYIPYENALLVRPGELQLCCR